CFSHPPSPLLSTLSLHDALPIFGEKRDWPVSRQLWWGHQIPVWSRAFDDIMQLEQCLEELRSDAAIPTEGVSFQVEEAATEAGRSEEHTSELQSRENLVCRLLLE